MKTKPPRHPGRSQGQFRKDHNKGPSKSHPSSQENAKKRFDRRTEGKSSGKEFMDNQKKKRWEEHEKNNKPAGKPEFRGKKGSSFAEKQEKGPSSYRKNKSFSRNKEARGEKTAPKPAETRKFEGKRPDKREFSRDEAVKKESPVRGLERGSVYGHHAAQAAWLNPEREIRALYITEQVLREFTPFIEQAKELGLKRPLPSIMDKRDIERLLPEGAVSQGVALAGAPLPEAFLRDILIHGETMEKSVILMLDQVTDPHNVGAILRSACAFGAAGMIMHRRHSPELNGVLLKTASGAAEHLPVSYETNLADTLEKLIEAGYTAYGLDERGEKTFAEIKFPAKCVLVLGAEGDGIRQRIRETCHQLVRLPTHEPIASLNVSNAAAVALYALLGAK